MDLPIHSLFHQLWLTHTSWLLSFANGMEMSRTLFSFPYLLQACLTAVVLGVGVLPASLRSRGFRVSNLVSLFLFCTVSRVLSLEAPWS